jgi:hypothetical protein
MFVQKRFDRAMKEGTIKGLIDLPKRGLFTASFVKSTALAKIHSGSIHQIALETTRSEILMYQMEGLMIPFYIHAINKLEFIIDVISAPGTIERAGKET